MASRPPTTAAERRYWAIGDTERLEHDDPEEAVSEYVDNIWPEGDLMDILDDTLTVEEYAPVKLSPEIYCRSWNSPLLNLLEQIDEEHGDPDGGPPDISEDLRKLERDFVSAVLERHHIWACEKTGNVEKIYLLDWVKKNRPEILNAK